MNTKNGDILVLAEWAASYEAIGKKNNFTPEEIACRVDWAQRLTGEAKP